MHSPWIQTRPGRGGSMGGKRDIGNTLNNKDTLQNKYNKIRRKKWLMYYSFVSFISLEQAIFG